MPKKVIPILSFSCASIFAVYLGLVVATVFFAAWETELAASLRDSESRIAALETQYYDAIEKLGTTNVASIGFHHPEKVEYVAASGKPTVTFANTQNP